MRQPLQGLRFGTSQSNLKRQFRRTPRHKRSHPNDNGDQTQPCRPAGRRLRRRADPSERPTNRLEKAPSSTLLKDASSRCATSRWRGVSTAASRAWRRSRRPLLDSTTPLEGLLEQTTLGVAQQTVEVGPPRGDSRSGGDVLASGCYRTVRGRTERRAWGPPERKGDAGVWEALTPSCSE